MFVNGTLLIFKMSILLTHAPIPAEDPGRGSRQPCSSKVFRDTSVEPIPLPVMRHKTFPTSAVSLTEARQFDIPNRSIVAVASYSSSPRGVLSAVDSFRFTLADGTEISTLDSSDAPGFLLERWNVPEDSEIVSLNVRTTPHSLCFLFVSSRGHSSPLFQVAIKSSVAGISSSPSYSDLCQQRFHLFGRGTRLNLMLHPSSTSYGSLAPIIGATYDIDVASNSNVERQHSDSSSALLCSVRRVDVFSSLQGVTGVTFVGFDDASTATYGNLFGSCSSFVLRDVGLSNANLVSERIVEILVLQDHKNVHSLQVRTDRGRMSACPLPTAEWQEHKVSSPWRFSRTVRDQLQLCHEQLHLQSPQLASMQLPVIPGNVVVETTQQLPVAASQNQNGRTCSQLLSIFDAYSDSESESDSQTQDASKRSCILKCIRGCWDLVCRRQTFGMIVRLLVYAAVAFVVALFIYGCVLTAHAHGKSTTFTIWLGGLLPFGSLSVLFGVVVHIRQKSISFRIFVLSRIFLFVGIFVLYCMVVSLVATYLWLLPWWTMTQNGTLNSVDASAEQWIQNNTAPDFGIYHFNQTAFVYHGKVGISGTGSTTYCVAPIVTSRSQTRVVFWAAAKDCCDAPSGSSVCWTQFINKTLSAYPLFRIVSSFESEYVAARQASCNALALNTNSTGSSLCSMPAVYLTIDQDPESKRKALQDDGFTFVGLTAGAWLFIVAVGSVMAMLAAYFFYLCFVEPLKSIVKELVDCVTELQSGPIPS